MQTGKSAEMTEWLKAVVLKKEDSCNSSVCSNFTLRTNWNTLFQITTQEVSIIKTITKDELNALVKNGIIRNTREGLVGKDGWSAGYTTTRNKAYIQDKYVDMAKKILSR